MGQTKIRAEQLEIASASEINTGTEESKVVNPKGLSDSAYAPVVGTQTIWIPAPALSPASTSPCADLEQIETTVGYPEIRALAFDASAVEHAVFEVAMPAKWNRGDLYAKFFWTGNSTNTGSVIWIIQAEAKGDADSIDAAFSAYYPQVTDAHNGTAYDQNISGLTTVIASYMHDASTDNEMIYFRIYRNATSDSFTTDALLQGVMLFYITDAGRDN